MIVGYQGEPGAFSEEAIIARFGAVQTRGYETFDALLASLEGGAVDRAFLPIHNSIAGTIHAAQSALDARPSVAVADEIVHRIEQCLIGVTGADLRALTCVYSHPVALAQCAQFFSGRPSIVLIPADDTAASVRRIVERGERPHAAIGSANAAERYGAVVLAYDIADIADNFTTFALLEPRGCATTP